MQDEEKRRWIFSMKEKESIDSVVKSMIKEKKQKRQVVNMNSRELRVLFAVKIWSCNFCYSRWKSDKLGDSMIMETHLKRAHGLVK